jgi:hypothetical protein
VLKDEKPAPPLPGFEIELRVSQADAGHARKATRCSTVSLARQAVKQGLKTLAINLNAQRRRMLASKHPWRGTNRVRISRGGVLDEELA